MHSPLKRLVTLVLLAAYLAANTVGGLLHDHRHEVACEHAACDHDHEHHGAGHHRHGAEASVEPSFENVASLHDDDCAVCRFVSQRTVAERSQAANSLSELSADIAVLRVPAPFTTLKRTTHSRAPPVVG